MSVLFIPPPTPSPFTGLDPFANTHTQTLSQPNVHLILEPRAKDTLDARPRLLGHDIERRSGLLCLCIERQLCVFREREPAEEDKRQEPLLSSAPLLTHLHRAGIRLRPAHQSGLAARAKGPATRQPACRGASRLFPLALALVHRGVPTAAVAGCQCQSGLRECPPRLPVGVRSTWWVARCSDRIQSRMWVTD